MSRALGLVAGKYRLERELGRGASGTVYLARVEPGDSLVAVKLLSGLEHSHVAERFEREVEILTRLPRHPHVAGVVDSGTHRGLPFLVLEYVPGGSLEARLEAGRWPPLALAVRLVAEVARGLDHLHRAGVVHRDVNARNVLLDDEGRARLVDFGLALDRLRITRLTETGELVGTPQTLAPEQLDGGPAAIGPGADVYAAASLLYRLVTRRDPFEGARDFAQLSVAIKTRVPRPVRQLEPAVPEALARAIEQGLAKLPADRPRSAGELARLLVAAVPGADVTETAALPESPADRPPIAKVSHFELETLLGKGASGSVYRARDERLGRRVAVKLLARLETPVARARFEREARTIASLQHPGIVALLDVGEERGVPFLVMELIDGEPLSRALRRGIDPREAARVVRDVALALAHAHAAGVVHRDVKPDNVLLSRDGRPHLTDFGIARAETDAALSQSGAIIGTPAYLSPEQALSEPATPRSDVYSLGVVLYEALARRLPHQAETLVALLDAITRERPTRPSEVNPLVPPALNAICLRALQKDPGARFESAEALAAELGRFLEGEAATRPRAGARWGAGALVAAGLALAAGTLAAAVRSRPSPSVALAPSPVAVASPVAASPSPAAVGSGARAVASLTPTLTHAFGDRRLSHRGVTSVACSEDGKLALSGGHDGVARLWDLESGREVRSFHRAPDEPASAVTAVAFTPSGDKVVAATEDGFVLVWATQDGTGPLLKLREAEVKHGVELKPAVVRALAVAPDGKSVLAVGDERTVRRWDLERATAPLQKSDIPGFAHFLATSADGTVVAAGVHGTVTVLWSEEKTRARRPKRLLFRTDEAKDGAIASIALSPGGDLLAVGTAKGLLEIWKTASNKVPPIASEPYKGKLDGPCLARFLSEDTLLITRGQGIGVLDLKGSLQLEPFSGHPDAIVASATSGGRLVTALKAGAIECWDLANRALGAAPAGHRGRVSSVCFSADGSAIFSTGDDDTVRRTEVGSPAAATQTLVAGGTLMPAGLFATRTRLLWRGNPSVSTWDLARSAASIACKVEGKAWVRSLAVAGEGRRCLLGLDGDEGKTQKDGRLRLWDGVDGSVLADFPTDAPVTAVALAPHGDGAAWGSLRGVIHKLASLPRTTGSEDVELKHPVPAQPVSALALSPDGTRLLAVVAGTLGVYDGASLTFSHVFGNATAIAFSSDVKLLAWSEASGPVHVVEIGATGWLDRGAIDLAADGDAATALAFDPDGRSLAVGTARGVVQRYELSGW